MAGTLGGAKTTIWYILKRKECTGKLSNTKRAGRPQKLTKVDDGRILSFVKKNISQHLGRSRKLEEVGISLSKSTIRRRLHECKYRGCTTRCKPLVTLKNRKDRLEFTRKHLKMPPQFQNKILLTDETKINLHQNYGKRMEKETNGS